MAGIINPTTKKHIATNTSKAIKVCCLNKSGEAIVRFTCVRVDGQSSADTTIFIAKHESMSNKLDCMIYGYVSSNVAFYTDNTYIYAYMPLLYMKCIVEILQGEDCVSIVSEFNTNDYNKITIGTKYTES